MAKSPVIFGIIIILLIGLIIGSFVDAQSLKLSDKKINNISKSTASFPINLKDTVCEIDNSNNYSENLRNIEFVSGEMIVRFEEDIDVSPKTIEDYVEIGVKSIDRLNKKYHVISIERILGWKTSSFFSNIYKFTFPEYYFVPEVAEEYTRDHTVIYAEPNYVIQTFVIPNDPYFNMQWALNQGNDCDIDAPEAWDTETGSSDIVIAIIDTGVDYTHPDLVSNIWINSDEIPNNSVDDDGNDFIDDIRGWDFVDNDNDPMDDNGHGTHCAGIAAAVSNNGVGITGVCWNCKVMAIRSGNESGLYVENIVKGIFYAVENGANIISMSWGGNIPTDLVKDALDYASSKGVVLVAAAGNDHIDLDHFPLPYVPAEYENVISVAATDSSDKRAQFSNYGFQVDVAAPGVNIYSTFLNNSYINSSGTSMACPHVAGLIALILSKISDLSPMEVRTILHSSTDTINSDKYIGFGRINALIALQKTASVIANIDFPKINTEVKGIIEIRGSAKGEQFQQYSVEYGRGIDPDSWELIKNSDEPVEDNILGFWDTTTVEEDMYTIRLILTNNDTTYIDRTWVMVNNFHNTIFADDDNKEGPWNGTEEFPYQLIQDAVDEAGTGDTVFVFNGSYREDIMVYTQIELVGEDKETTIIEASKNSCITIFADGVNVGSLTLISGAYSLEIFSNNNTIKDNIIKSFLMPHISYGIIIKPFFFYIGYTRGGDIIEITPNLQGNTIAGNEIIKHYMGIWLNSASNNTIYHNNFIDNLISAYHTYFSFSVIDFELHDYYKYRPPSINNRWYENYWDDWLGLKQVLFKISPKLITGEIDSDIRIFFSGDRALHNVRLNRWFNFDWHPLFEPYEAQRGV